MVTAEPITDRIRLTPVEVGLDITSSRVDPESGVIRGVSLATAGVEAIGHGEETPDGEYREYWTDGRTLETMLECWQDLDEPLKARYTHDGDLEAVVGTWENLRIEGNHLRADFYELRDDSGESPESIRPVLKQIYAMARKMPKQFGTSVDAGLVRERDGERDLMRCTRLNSADFVDRPAINSGLFKSGIDNHGKRKQTQLNNQPDNIMDKDQMKQLEEKIEGLSKSLESVTELQGKLASVEEKLASYEDRMAKIENPEKNPEKNLEENLEEKMEEKEDELKALSAVVTQLSAKIDKQMSEMKQLGIVGRIGNQTSGDQGQTSDNPEQEFQAKLSAIQTTRKATKLEAFNQLVCEEVQLAEKVATAKGCKVWELYQKV